jgi:hypothetical protein
MAEHARERPDRKSEKFIGYFRLVDKCGESGCPVCRLVTEDSRHYLTALLYGQVTDPDTRRRLRAAWGFCNWHAWMLLDIENSYSGAAIIYEDLVRLVTDRVRRLTGRSRRGRFASLLPWLDGRSRRPPAVYLYRRRELCPVCQSTAQAEARYAETMIRFIREAELQLAYARSDGLCVPHALQAIELADATTRVSELLEPTLQKWARLREDLESFVRKHDYRNAEPFTEADAASYRRAFEMLTGAEGVFGNDLHVSSRRAASLSTGAGPPARRP